MYRKITLLSLVFSLLCVATFAQKEAIERTWYNQEKTSKIRIFKATDGKWYGKIVWLKEPNENGKPRADKNNPTESQRSRTLMDLQILKGFSKTANNVFEGGTVYDPNNGKTYCGKLTLNANNTITLKGFICSLSFLGRSSTWTLAE